VWDCLFHDIAEKKGRAKIEQVCMQVKNEMKRKVGKDPGEGVRNVRKWGMNHL